MLRTARFALVIGLSAAIPVVFALNPPQKQQDKQQPKDDKKKGEPAKKPATDDRLDRRDARMKERNREIDGLLNKKK